MATRPFNDFFWKIILHMQVVFIHIQWKQYWISAIPVVLSSHYKTIGHLETTQRAFWNGKTSSWLMITTQIAYCNGLVSTTEPSFLYSYTPPVCVKTIIWDILEGYTLRNFAKNLRAWNILCSCFEVSAKYVEHLSKKIIY